MWGSFIVHVSFLLEILFRKCGEGKYVGSIPGELFKLLSKYKNLYQRRSRNDEIF